jgi:hypothetical protein
MTLYTIFKRIFILEQYISNNKQIKPVQINFKKEFNVRKAPCELLIKRIYWKFKKTGSVCDD